MKKIYTLLTLSLVISTGFAQGDTFIRSSLHMALIEDFGFDNGPLVRQAYDAYPFPIGAYNDHRIPLNQLSLSQYELTPEEELAYGVNKTATGAALSELGTGLTAGIVQDNSKVEYQLMKYIDQNKMAHGLIRKWFNISDDGSFDQAYIRKMIDIQVTKEQELEAIASGSESAARDQNREYLIDNTYVVFTRMNFVSNAVVAEGIRQVAYATADELEGMMRDLAYKAADKIYEKTSEGFSVWTTGWLFDLKWEDEDFQALASCIVDGKIDFQKFNEIPFQLNFVGTEKATSLVTFSLKKGEGQRTDEQIIDLSTNRNIDKVLVKLQRGYEQFMPIFPIQSEEPLGAYLGTKEGIEGGEKFEILEKNADGTYKAVGTLTVDKNNVWDNQYGSDAGEGMTLFKGKLPKGMGKGTLIRQKR